MTYFIFFFPHLEAPSPWLTTGHAAKTYVDMRVFSKRWWLCVSIEKRWWEALRWWYFTHTHDNRASPSEWTSASSYEDDDDNICDDNDHHHDKDVEMLSTWRTGGSMTDYRRRSKGSKTASAEREAIQTSNLEFLSDVSNSTSKGRPTYLVQGSFIPVWLIFSRTSVIRALTSFITLPSLPQ